MSTTKIDLSVSLLISTYNNPDFLKLCLKSVLVQTILPGEVVIADDGSTESTSELINSFRKILPIPIIHVWQPDEGFQAGKIRNIAIAASKGEYIIQIDGDIIMEKHFIADHLCHQKEHTILQGSRVFITEAKTKQLIKNNKIHLSLFSRGLRRQENAIRSKLISTYLSTRYRNRYPIYYARGCNMSFYKDDFIRVNGYNHDFVGWGHEDSELTLRMLNSGCKKDYIKFHCTVYHLYHPERSRNSESTNKELMDEQVEKNAVWCDNGINSFLATYKEYIKEKF